MLYGFFKRFLGRATSGGVGRRKEKRKETKSRPDERSQTEMEKTEKLKIGV